jgi:small subunit ribosomal protein S6
VLRAYEAVYIFDSSLEDAAISEKMTKHHALLGATGEIALNLWGRRQLAYKIGSKESGYYIVAKFECDPTALPEFERSLKLDDSVVRWLISVDEHELGAPPMTEEQLAARARGDDDDDDED